MAHIKVELATCWFRSGMSLGLCVLWPHMVVCQNEEPQCSPPNTIVLIMPLVLGNTRIIYHQPVDNTYIGSSVS